MPHNPTTIQPTKRRFRFYLIALCVLLSVGCSRNDITGAGVIAYAQHDSQQYFLLADHAGLAFFRGYGAFGGGLDNNENPKQGALREFHEETACHFMGQVESISKESVRTGNHVSFIIRIPFIDSEQLNNTSPHPECRGGVYAERARWVWVEKNAFLKQLKTGNSFKSEAVDISLWDKSTAVFKKAQQQGLLSF